MPERDSLYFLLLLLTNNIYNNAVFRDPLLDAQPVRSCHFD
jgi:hypothetical protein